jgi:hypothetical protein
MCSFVSLSILIFMYDPFCVFCFIVLFCVLFLCKCVLYYSHSVNPIAVKYTYLLTYPLSYLLSYLVTYLLIYLLTYLTYSLHEARVLEKLTGLQLVKKFPAFYGTRMFIAAFTSACHVSLS